MRGKAKNTETTTKFKGITPAYAGKSADYFGVTTDYLGSPPPMRGKDWRFHSGHASQRITPAYAGKRPVVAAVLNRVRDHPRLCGEKYGRVLADVIDIGSPPPMRGKDKEFLQQYTNIRITPAYAGKRKILGGENDGNQDHPRLCGEKWHIMRTLSTGIGSPPPMRGKDNACQIILFHFRITPAYAGKSVQKYRMRFV